MEFFKQSFNSLLSGSHVAFKAMERPVYSEPERELDLENKRKIQESIGLLRKMRTSALETSDQKEQQSYLKEAHELSDRVAQIIIDLCAKESPVPLEAAFQEKILKLNETHAEQDAGSGYSLPPQFSVQNLFRATDDILVRINEKATSFKEPDHKFNLDELKYVLHEFLRGTNGLNNDAIEAMFSSNSKVGGILSGGAIYAEIVKRIIEKYADPSLRIDTFVIAVDKHNNKAVFEHSETDKETTNIILVDDVINEGGTMITALWSAGEHFPNARIRSEKGSDYAGEWKKRKNTEFMDHLGKIYQDFAEFAEEGKNDEAMKIFKEAEAYALEKGVELQAGWHKRKARIEGKLK